MPQDHLSLGLQPPKSASVSSSQFQIRHFQIHNTSNLHTSGRLVMNEVQHIPPYFGVDLVTESHSKINLESLKLRSFNQAISSSIEIKSC